MTDHEKRCGVQDDEGLYFCTLPDGHAGPHEAHVGPNGTLIGTWGDPDAGVSNVTRAIHELIKERPGYRQLLDDRRRWLSTEEGGSQPHINVSALEEENARLKAELGSLQEEVRSLRSAEAERNEWIEKARQAGERADHWQREYKTLETHIQETAITQRDAALARVQALEESNDILFELKTQAEARVKELETENDELRRRSQGAGECGRG